jgi:hypothetical protein
LWILLKRKIFPGPTKLQVVTVFGLVGNSKMAFN